MTNPYTFSDQEYYMRRYINDLPKIHPELNISDDLNNWDDLIEIILKSLPTSCPNLQQVTCYSDNFNRANTISLGSPWIEYSTDQGSQNANVLNIASNQISILRNPSQGAPSNTGQPVGAIYGSFLDTLVDQSSSLIFKGINPVDPSQEVGPNVTVYIGVGARLKQRLTGTIWETNTNGYLFEYGHTFSKTSPYAPISGDSALVSLYRIENGGHAILNQINMPAIAEGTEIRITVANFNPGDFTRACIKCYFDNTLIFNKTDNSPYLTGRPGIGTINYLSGAGFAILGEDWQGCEMEAI